MPESAGQVPRSSRPAVGDPQDGEGMAWGAPDHKVKSSLMGVVHRWRAARLRALARASGTDGDAHVDESRAVLAVPPDRLNALLRDVFDASRQVGLETLDGLETPFSVTEIAKGVEAADLSCFRGLWSELDDGATRRLEREGCGLERCTAVCDYWREAADGLVMGLGDEARYARHRSVGHGDGECVDVWSEVGMIHRRWGEVPENVTSLLEPLRLSFAESGVRLTLLGYSERVLFYRLVSGTRRACGAGGTLLQGLVSRALEAGCPGAQALEVTPRGVLLEGDG